VRDCGQLGCARVSDTPTATEILTYIHTQRERERQRISVFGFVMERLSVIKDMIREKVQNFAFATSREIALLLFEQLLFH
jgi:hypothetical protein